MTDQQLPFEDEDDGPEPELEQDYQLLHDIERDHGLDVVVETATGRVCWASELTPQEEAAGFRIRRDLTAPELPF
jgi:hypothetical protein